MNGPRVVVIGAGVVGAAVADELTARGWTDVTVLDQGALWAAGGSSSHAPGLVFQANGSKTMTELATYTVEKLCTLDVDGQPCFLQVGGLEVATTPERLRDLYRRHGWLKSWGVDSTVLSSEECLERFPLLAADQVLGGLLNPTDGLARAVPAVEAQGRRAMARGAAFVQGCEVLDILTDSGAVTGVATSLGDYPADIVVCCAGIWGQKVAGMVGLALPLTPLAHQLASTGPVPALEGRGGDPGHPILRHQDQDLYYRHDGDRLVIGYYGHDPMPVDVADIASEPVDGVMPSVHTFTPEDFKPAWDESRKLLPALDAAELASGINGIFSFTTDGFPLVGQSPDVSGFWVAEAVWVTHSAGVARAVAEWLVDGSPSYDMHECDLNRFERHQLADEFVLARDCQNFVEVYDIIHPLQPMAEPRPLRTSPFYGRHLALGGQFLEAAGWERPQWLEANAALLEGRDLVTPNDWAARYWSPIVGAEAQATRERVALYDMTALKRLEVRGAGATSFLQHLCTGNVDKSVGAVTYCLLLDERGRIRSDITVARLGRDHYQVGANGNLDLDWFQRHLPGDGSVFVTDITAGTCCVGIWGPRARDVVQTVTRTDVSNAGFRYFRAQPLFVGMVPVTAMRLSYVGELGWELYTTADMGLKLWDTLWDAGREHGIFAAGRGAFTSLRIEKGYRSFGSDMTWDHTPDEAGLGFAVRMDKADFVGRAALEQRDSRDVSRRLTCLTIRDPRAVLMGKEPVVRDGDRVGYVTSAAYGYTAGVGIAYAWLRADLTVPGTAVQVEYFDEIVDATVAAEPVVDPSMTRLRS